MPRFSPRNQTETVNRREVDLERSHRIDRSTGGEGERPRLLQGPHDGFNRSQWWRGSRDRGRHSRGSHVLHVQPVVRGKGIFGGGWVMSMKNTTRCHTHPRVVSNGRIPTRYKEPIMWSHAYLALQATTRCMHSPDRACTRPIENIVIDSVSLYCASSADGRTTSWSPVINHS